MDHWDGVGQWWWEFIHRTFDPRTGYRIIIVFDINAMIALNKNRF